ncbi:MAG: hypothetical protein R3C31_09970 [Hyphomonadaceae bacterium]
MPHDTADDAIHLTGAMWSVIVSDPSNSKTDIGPIIDAEAKGGSEAHGAHEARSQGAEA